MLIRICGLRTSWQKSVTLIPKNSRACLAKQDQAGSYNLCGLQLNYDEQLFKQRSVTLSFNINILYLSYGIYMYIR